MNKIIYHRGTGTYFDISDDVYVINLDEVTEPIDDEIMDTEGDEIATYWGRPLVGVITGTDPVHGATWVVRHDSDDLYWNNDLGYVDRASATVFTNDERLMFDLPLEGAWAEAN